LKILIYTLVTIFFMSGNISLVLANDLAPWGSANVLKRNYEPSKVLYDVTSGDRKIISNILSLLAHLNKTYGSDTFDSSIVVVIHGDAIPFFAISEYKSNIEIMKRAQSLTVGTSIEFRMCRAAAKLLKYEPNDIHGFVKMVPMADAEIIQLQRENYFYMQ